MDVAAGSPHGGGVDCVVAQGTLLVSPEQSICECLEQHGKMGAFLSKVDYASMKLQKKKKKHEAT